MLANRETLKHVLVTMSKPSHRSPKAPQWHTGEAVAELLGESNRSKAAAALGMGTTVTTMYRWLKDAEWPQRNIEKASAFFGVSEEWLMFGTGEKYAGPSGPRDPHAARVEIALMRFEADVKRLTLQYTKELRNIYAPEDANTPPTPKSKRRDWDTRPSDEKL